MPRMPIWRRLSDAQRYTCAALLTVGVAGLHPARAQTALLTRNVPAFVANTRDQGAADPAQVIDVSLWLNLRDRSGLDALAQSVYMPSSPDYHRWLTRAALAARFAPTQAEAQTVARFLTAHHLQVTQIGADNLFVRARGRVADVQTAFGVRLDRFQVRGKLLRANTAAPSISGPAASLVRAVDGLDSGGYEQHVLVRGAGGRADMPADAPAVTASDPGFFNTQCFSVASETRSTDNAGLLPKATISGNRISLETLTSAGCGYTPAPLYAAYDLGSLYGEGFTGVGQTIAIVDWCGSSTVQSDANAFSRRFGLPLLTKSNFSVIYTPTRSDCIGEDQVEINLDVEWAHAIAPGASIDLVVPPSASFQDVDEALFTAVNSGLGNSISGSFGSPEDETPPSVLETENLVAEIAATMGVSANFSTGDSGDNAGFSGPQTVNAPADSPWATAVGGVSLALNPNDSIAWQTGWGTNSSVLAAGGTIYDPPQPNFFLYGSGGGVSTCVAQTASGTCSAGFAKPAFQRRLPGALRMLPDLSWLADPTTGAVIAITIPGQSPGLSWQVIGGTSLAAPMFSGLWAIANEEAGMPLGQAAQYLYFMPVRAITDIVPHTSATNVVDVVKESGQVNSYGPKMVIGGTSTTAPGSFISAYNNVATYPEVEVLSFGTDCAAASFGADTACNSASALHTRAGWDDVTGLGVPDGRAFADAFRSPGVSPETK